MILVSLSVHVYTRYESAYSTSIVDLLLELYLLFTTNGQALLVTRVCARETKEDTIGVTESMSSLPTGSSANVKLLLYSQPVIILFAIIPILRIVPHDDLSLEEEL